MIREPKRIGFALGYRDSAGNGVAPPYMLSLSRMDFIFRGCGLHGLGKSKKTKDGKQTKEKVAEWAQPVQQCRRFKIIELSSIDNAHGIFIGPIYPTTKSAVDDMPTTIRVSKCLFLGI